MSTSGWFAQTRLAFAAGVLSVCLVLPGPAMAGTRPVGDEPTADGGDNTRPTPGDVGDAPADPPKKPAAPAKRVIWPWVCAGVIAAGVAGAGYLRFTASPPVFIEKPTRVEEVDTLPIRQIGVYNMLRNELLTKGVVDIPIVDADGNTPGFVIFTKGTKATAADRIKKAIQARAPDLDPKEYGAGAKGMRFPVKNLRLELADKDKMTVNASVQGGFWHMPIEGTPKLSTMIREDAWELAFPEQKYGEGDGEISYAAWMKLHFDTENTRWVMPEAHVKVRVVADVPFLGQKIHFDEQEAGELRDLRSVPLVIPKP